MNARLLAMTIAGFLAATAAVTLVWGAPKRDKPAPDLVREIKVERGLSDLERECIRCHSREEPGKVGDWSHSLHARANVTRRVARPP